MPVRDGIFCAVFKVYSMLSGRRFTSDLCDAQAKGHISSVPHFNPVLRVFEKEETTSILRELVAHSAAPLAAIESNFAIDSTGFSGCRYDQWDQRSGTMSVLNRPRSGQGSRDDRHATNVVTSVEVTTNNSADAPFLPNC